MGHPVVISANYGLGGAPLNIENSGETTRVLPAGFTAHGNDIIGSHARFVKADIVITLYDSWVFDPQVTAGFRWVPWAPVDHAPLPEAVKRALMPAWQPIAYSRFGFDKMKEAGLDPRYVPHGIDTDTYQPMDMDEARKSIKLPRDDYDFLAVMVAANKGVPSRKSFGEVLDAWASFVQYKPKALLYMHTHPGEQMQGMDIPMLIRLYGLTEENVCFCDPYWNLLGYPDTYLRDLYSAADVLVSPSKGEGFGIPLVEAQACGCPVIVTDATAMSELCFSGWKVGYQREATPLGAFQFVPRVGEILDSLLDAYAKRGYEKMRRDARRGAEPYSADIVAETYWRPVLDELAQSISGDADPLGLVDLGAA